jgi:DNA-binding CsgD family transcriptional regulator
MQAVPRNTRATDDTRILRTTTSTRATANRSSGTGPALRAVPLPVAPPRPLGRDELLAAARAALTPERGLLLTGPLGIGKTALLDTLGHESTTAGARVLRCTPGADDTGLPHAALIDLLHPVPDREHVHLPAHQRAVLRSALLRGSRPGDRVDRLALRLAVTATLERIARDTPLLLVLDGVERIDPFSADVLAHLVRHAPGGVTVAAARRDGARPVSGGERRLWPQAALELTVPPLPDETVTALLERAGRNPGPARLRQLLRLAAGNPFYATELATELASELAAELARRVSGGSRATANPADHPEDHQAGPEDLPLPPALRALVLRQAADLPAAARTALLLAATAARPSLGLLHAAGVADPVADLGEAERRGLLRIAADGGLRPAHPLLAAALRADAGTGQRLAAHAALARAVTEPVERARHLALAHPYEDQRVAGALAEAAATARSQGFADTAYELAVLAAARTPAADAGDRHRRLLAAAAHAADAGRHDDARRAADRVLAETPDAASRVHARLTLLETAGQALDDSGALIEGGLADAAGDPALQSRLHFWSAVRELLGGRTAGAAAEAGRAAALAADSTDPTQVDALGLLATVQSMRGRPAAAESALASALRLAGRDASASLLRRKALVDLDADRVAEARRRIAALAEREATGSGAVEESLATLVAQIRIQARAGECERAVATAERCTRLLDAAGVVSPLGDYAAALAQTVGGSVARALELARSAVAGCAADGDRLFEIRALGVLGGAGLLAGEVHGAAEAAEALQRARELGAAMELADPDTVRRLADLAEALVLLGDHAGAGRVLAQARGLTGSWPPAWGEGALAALDRSAGLLLAGLGSTAEAVDALRGSAARLRAVPLPLDLARTLVCWATVERRARHRAAARTVLAEAEQLCGSRAAYPLLARVRQERDRLDPGERSGEAAELTPSEKRVAELVAGGATNREVAAVLCVSVKTVEGTLSRVYRKLGVRSRTGLARAVGSGQASGRTSRQASGRTSGQTSGHT